MLAALNLGAVLAGVGAGCLGGWLGSLAAWPLLYVVGIDFMGAGLLAGVLIGFAVGGWVSGRMAHHSNGFHGAVTGLLLAGVVIVLSRLGGSPAVGTGTVLTLCGLSMALAGGAGWLAGRRRRNQAG